MTDVSSSPSRRNVLSLGLVGVASFGAAACSADPSAPTVQQGSASASPPDTRTIKPFRVDASSGPASGLPKRAAFMNIVPGGAFVAMGKNMKTSAEARGLEFLDSNAQGNSAKYVDQLNQTIARGVGAMVVAPLDVAAQKGPLMQALNSGVGVLSIVTAPATQYSQTDQHAVGSALAGAAVEYIKSALGGNANVLIMNSDSAGPEEVKRHKGILETLAAAGSGVKIALDVEPKGGSTSEAGFATAETAMQAHPEINVVLGSDSPVVGAYRAIEQAGKLRNDMYFGGIDGDPEAIALVKQGGAYRTSHAFAWEVLGYAYGQYAADWIEGRSIPQALLVNPVSVTKNTAEQYAKDMANAGAVFADPDTLAIYLELLGNISYAERQNYWTTDFSPGS